MSVHSTPQLEHLDLNGTEVGLDTEGLECVLNRCHRLKVLKIVASSMWIRKVHLACSEIKIIVA